MLVRMQSENLVQAGLSGMFLSMSSQLTVICCLGSEKAGRDSPDSAPQCKNQIVPQENVLSSSLLTNQDQENMRLHPIFGKCVLEGIIFIRQMFLNCPSELADDCAPT